jgi:hypothetical protein
VFYIGVVKIDQNVAHVAIDIHLYFKCIFKLFHLFQKYIASVSSACCKSRSGCCIYMHVASVCFSEVFSCLKRMFNVFLFGCCIYFAMVTCVFPVFQTYVASVSAVLDICCKCFI